MVMNSHTAVVERNVTWQGAFASEPYEVGWASEAIIFLRTLEATGASSEPLRADVQISPDGMHWCDEGTSLSLSVKPGVTFAKVKHFGGWLRIVGTLPPGVSIKLILYYSLKG